MLARGKNLQGAVRFRLGKGRNYPCYYDYVLPCGNLFGIRLLRVNR